MRYLRGMLIMLAGVLFFFAGVAGAFAEPYRLRIVSGGLFCLAVAEVLTLTVS